MTEIDCPNITGAKAPVAPVLNTPLQCKTYFEIPSGLLLSAKRLIKALQTNGDIIYHLIR